MFSKHAEFEKGEPSLFIIGSPFQLLCAYEAIHTFNIYDYKIIVVYNESDSRKNQIFSMLEAFKLKYSKCEENKIHASRMIFNKSIWGLNKKEKKYNRIFIGNYDLISYRTIALSQANNGCNFIFLDDGNASIHFLKKGHYKHSFFCSLLEKIFLGISHFRGINPEKYFFSIYNDINTYKVVYPNKFDHLGAQLTNSDHPEKCYFIGTNSTEFVRAMGISLEKYRAYLKKALEALKKQYGSTVYIPHGRDINSNDKELCQYLSISYTPLQEAIELYLVKNGIRPQVVAGFSSSALFNIKKIFPNSQVINLFIAQKNSPDYKVYSEIAEYYKKNNIEKQIL